MRSENGIIREVPASQLFIFFQVSLGEKMFWIPPFVGAASHRGA
jgi:hypothetical protein